MIIKAGRIFSIIAFKADLFRYAVLYKNGVQYIERMNRELKEWMEKKQYRSINEFKGKMNYSNLEDPAAYERAQFIKYFSKHH